MHKNNKILKPIRCLICNKNIFHSFSFTHLLASYRNICYECYKKFEVVNTISSFEGYEMRLLYNYNDFLRNMLFQYKGCYDIFLSDVFLDMFIYKLRKYYNGYAIVYPPSSVKSIFKRGFDHIFEMLKNLNFPIYNIFYKKSDFKQSSTNYLKRSDVQELIGINEQIVIKEQKILIFDDVMTSGMTIITCLNLFKKAHPEKNIVQILILCRNLKKF